MLLETDHLLKYYCKDKLKKDLDVVNGLKQVLVVLDEIYVETLGTKIKENT